MTATTTEGGPGAIMRCVWGALGLFFTFITAKVLLADVSTYDDFKTDHLLTIGALTGAVVAGVFFGPMLRRGRVIAAVGLGLSFSAATVYCLIGSAGRGDELAYEKNAEARKINETRLRYERDREEAKKRWETAMTAEAAECATGFANRCKGRQAVTAQARKDFEVATILVNDAKPEARENGKLRRAAELWTLSRGGDIKDAEKALALLWPFLPPAICELLSIIFWHQALAQRHKWSWSFQLPEWRRSNPLIMLPAPSPVVSTYTPTVSDSPVAEFPTPSKAYVQAKKSKPTDAQMVLDALERAGRPLSNDELAEQQGVSKGESSKRLRNCGNTVVVKRVGKCYAVTPNFMMV